MLVPFCWGGVTVCAFCRHFADALLQLDPKALRGPAAAAVAPQNLSLRAQRVDEDFWFIRVVF